MKTHEYVSAKDWNGLTVEQRRAYLNYLAFLGVNVAKSAMSELFTEPEVLAIVVSEKNNLGLTYEDWCSHLRRVPLDEIVESCNLFTTF